MPTGSVTPSPLAVFQASLAAVQTHVPQPAPKPGDGIFLNDIRHLNESRPLGDAHVPLEIYLRNALVLGAAESAPRPSGPFFKSGEAPQALESCLAGIKENLKFGSKSHVDDAVLRALGQWLIDNSFDYPALRPLLFEGVHRGYFASLSMVPIPAAQIFTDLNALDQERQIIGGVIPFKIYLQNLSELSAGNA